MLATLIAAWLVASPEKRKRNWGFWGYLLSNALWILWGGYAGAFLRTGSDAKLTAPMTSPPPSSCT